jgi:putative ABC transport system ATP-binding protein
VTSALAVRLESVVKHYRLASGVVRAVDGIDLDVGAGTSLAIVGPSGSGKSTLLSLIGALDVPDRGRVVVGEQVVSDLPERERARLRRERFGFLFQSHDLLPFLTAVENVGLQLALQGSRDGDALSRRMLHALDLAEQADKLPDQLSGGQRQRVALARALIHAPGLLLADEPTGELDATTASAVVDLLLRFQDDTGATLVVVTHDMRVAERMDRVVPLMDGRLADAATARGPDHA